MFPTFPEDIDLMFQSTATEPVLTQALSQEVATKGDGRFGHGKWIGTDPSGSGYSGTVQASGAQECSRTYPTGRPSQLAKHYARLKSLRDRAIEGCEIPPSVTALANAGRTLLKIFEHGFSVDRVVADADGGVSFYFFGNEKTAGGASRLYACMTVTNENPWTLTVLFGDRSQSASTASDWQVSDDLTELVGRIAAHVRP